MRWLDGVGGVNVWSYGEDPSFAEGDSQTLYLQLVDEASVSPPITSEGRWPARRYVPAAGATLTATLDSVDDVRKVVRVMTQPFSVDDRSIWRLDISPADPVRGTVALRLALNESGVKHSVILKAGLRISSMERI